MGTAKDVYTVCCIAGTKVHVQKEYNSSLISTYWVIRASSNY